MICYMKPSEPAAWLMESKVTGLLAGVSRTLEGDLPGQGAASAQPLVLHVAAQDVLGPLEQHGQRHPGDEALLRRGGLVAEGELQQRLEADLGEVLPHPHLDLRLCGPQGGGGNKDRLHASPTPPQQTPNSLTELAALPVKDADCEWMDPRLSIAMIWPTKSLGMKLAKGKISVLMSWTTCKHRERKKNQV